MNVFLKIIFIIILIYMFIWTYKIIKYIKIEKRINPYTLGKISQDTDSLIDKLFKIKEKYFINITQSKKISNYANKYYNQKENPLNYVISKLTITLVTLIILLISCILRRATIPFIIFLIVLIVSYYIYDIYYIYLKKSKQKQIKKDILRSVIILNNAFKAGKSTLQATKIVSKELEGALSLEYQKIYNDLEYGVSSDVAFNRFAKRVKIEEAYYIASSLTILSKTGGNIIKVFSAIEKTLFDKQKLEEELKNQTAASNLVVKVLMVIPILFTLIIYALSPGYFELMFTTALGKLMLIIIVAMFMVFIYLLKTIMKVRI